MKEAKYRPRNNLVLIRITKAEVPEGGLEMPDTSIQGKDFFVEAVGPEVEDLQVGDKVIMMGRHGVDYYEHPIHRDLIVIKEENVALVVE